MAGAARSRGGIDEMRLPENGIYVSSFCLRGLKESRKDQECYTCRLRNEILEKLRGLYTEMSRQASLNEKYEYYKIFD